MSYFTIGSTGFVGSYFLAKALESPEVTKIFSLTRKDLQANGDKLTKLVSKNTEEWTDIIKESKDVPAHSTFFSAFGTTRKTAGSAENFVKIDHGINYNCFKAAKESGKYDTAIIVSSVGANKDSFLLYLKTKGQLEQDIIDLKFKKTIILRPGFLMGQRKATVDMNGKIGSFIGNLTRGTIFSGLAGHPVYAEEVANCALKMSLDPMGEEGEVIIVESKEIIDLAK